MARAVIDSGFAKASRTMTVAMVPMAGEKAAEADAVLVPFKDFDERKFKAAISDADALVLLDRPLNRNHIEVMERCKIILALQVGYDFIDVQAATEFGVVVTNAPSVNADSVADFTLALLLALVRRVVEADRAVRAGDWPPLVGVEARYAGACYALPPQSQFEGQQDGPVQAAVVQEHRQLRMCRETLASKDLHLDTQQLFVAGLAVQQVP